VGTSPSTKMFVLLMAPKQDDESPITYPS